MIRQFLARRRFMHEHRFAQSRMSGYVDGELSPAESRRVEEHVGVCPTCRRVLATLKRTIQGLHALHPEQRPGLADGVIERLRHP